jgi:alpha-1,6-mannosyltransferase
MKRIFFLLGSAQALCYVFMLSAGNLRQHIVAGEILFFAAFALFLSSLIVLRSQEKTQHTAGPPQNRNWYGLFLQQNYYLVCIILFALCFRGILWFSPPTLSDDIYRYVWEGKMVASGINPFAAAPSDPTLANLRDQSIYPSIARSNLTAIYPPLSQFIFALSSWLSPTVNAMKLTFIIFDILTIGILLLTLRALNMPLTRSAIYAMNPLIIMEFAGSGHSDSAGIFFLLCALYLFLKKRAYSPVVCLAMSVLNKFLPLFLLPFMLGRKKIAAILLFVAVSALFYAPFLSAGIKLFQSLGIYIEHWFFNASLYDLFYWVFNDKTAAQSLSAALFLLIITGMFVWYIRKDFDERGQALYQVVFTGLGSFLLLTPVVHPWYVCWIVPLLVVLPNRAWIFLSGAIFLSYLVLRGYVTTGVWVEDPLVKLAQYLPFYGLLLYDAGHRFVRSIAVKAFRPEQSTAAVRL